MSSAKIQAIKDAKIKYGFNLKQAYDFVCDKIEARDAITSLYYKNQRTIENQWHWIRYPNGQPMRDSIGIVAGNSGHTGIICNNCKAKGTTKNIAPLGCRTLFIQHNHSGARKCTFDDIQTIKPALVAKDFEPTMDY